MATTLEGVTDQEAGLGRMGDVELAEYFFDLIGDTGGDEDDASRDRLYFALDEVLERFAPHVAAVSRMDSIWESMKDPGKREKELTESLDHIGARQAFRLAERVNRARGRDRLDA